MDGDGAREQETAMNGGGKYLLMLVALCAGCERPIPVPDQTPGVIGYEVQGTVTDQIGNPVPNVKVYVDYIGSYVYTDSAATRQYFISDPSASVQTVVVNWNNQLIRVLTPLQTHYGWYQVLWNGKDSTGFLPPSGIYYVEYLVNGVPRFSYNQLVSGGQVAATDAQGHYTIPIQYLPVDSSSVPVFSSYDSTYVGNLLISNAVIFTFAYPTNVHQIQRSLTKGQVTIINLILQ
jgi:hypothetical protein